MAAQLSLWERSAGLCGWAGAGWKWKRVVEGRRIGNTQQRTVDSGQVGECGEAVTGTGAWGTYLPWLQCTDTDTVYLCKQRNFKVWPRSGAVNLASSWQRPTHYVTAQCAHECLSHRISTNSLRIQGPSVYLCGCETWLELQGVARPLGPTTSHTSQSDTPLSRVPGPRWCRSSPVSLPGPFNWARRPCSAVASRISTRSLPIVPPAHLTSSPQPATMASNPTDKLKAGPDALRKEAESSAAFENLQEEAKIRRFQALARTDPARYAANHPC